MRLDCPNCGAKGDSRKTKTPMWRCSPAPSNGGCGYEWDDPNYDAPTIDYKALGYSDKEHYEYITGFDARIREEQRARIKIKDEERARRPREEELRRNPPPPPAAPVPPPPLPMGGRLPAHISYPENQKRVRAELAAYVAEYGSAENFWETRGQPEVGVRIRARLQDPARAPGPVQAPEPVLSYTGAYIFSGLIFFVVYGIFAVILFRMEMDSATDILLWLIALSVFVMVGLGSLTLIIPKLEEPLAQQLTGVLGPLAKLLGPIAVIVFFGCFIGLLVVGSMNSSGGDGYMEEEECRVEDRGGRIREICW